MADNILKINLHSEEHKNIIMKLSNRNDFFKDDLYTSIYRDAPFEIKKKMIEFTDITTYNEEIKKLFVGIESYGYFIIINEDNKKKVVGFIIYDIGKDTEETEPELILYKSELTFILIDKKYQNRGFGTKLINKYIQDMKNIEKKLIHASVKFENKKLDTFYKRNGFNDYSDLFEINNSKYNRLYYIPSISLIKLKTIKLLQNMHMLE